MEVFKLCSKMIKEVGGGVHAHIDSSSFESTNV